MIKQLLKKEQEYWFSIDAFVLKNFQLFHI